MCKFAAQLWFVIIFLGQVSDMGWTSQTSLGVHGNMCIGFLIIIRTACLQLQSSQMYPFYVEKGPSLPSSQWYKACRIL